ncbi:hypothetical protein RO21_00500 [[Actinobacillus] muris]|uniref:DUF5067 domain-containing protein n=1 Tax=Muribacter muris TaxID=67855 RepID=A0A0J5P809_9PAST|nr:hypothetical protein [Muribacter muris]KMK52533.1 hypothetical protein RO21_00500 [[Actinobacillus] muris] [Muribacter muris]
MKLLKHIAAISLLVAFGAGNAYAETNTKKAENNKAVAAKKSTKSDQALKQFNKAFGIRLVGRSMTKDEAGNPVFVATYELENKSKQRIKAVHWIGGYSHNQQILFAQDFPLNFDPALKAKSKITVNINLPFDKIPEQARAVIADPNAEISVVNGAKRLEFSSKKVIEIK